MLAWPQAVQSLKGINGDESGRDDEIDLTYLKQLSQGDESMIQGLLAELATRNRQDLAALIELFVKDDYAGMAALAHGIKGAAGSFEPGS